MNTLRRTKLKGWFEFYRETCPICGKSGACMVNEKGDKVACTRVESKIIFSKELFSWIHPLTETKKVDADVSFNKTHKKAMPSLLDVAYRALLHCTNLSDAHYDHLESEDRQLTDEQITTRGYRSFPSKPWNTVKEITKLTHFQHFQGFPGFYKNDYGWTMIKRDGILIPFRDHYNHIVGFQIRVDEPRLDVEINRNELTGLAARVKEQPNLVQCFVDGQILWEKHMELGQVEEVNHEGKTGSVKLVKGTRYFWLSSSNQSEGTGAGDPAPIHVAVPTSQLKEWEYGTLRKARAVWITEGGLKADISADHLENVYTKEQLETLGDTFIAIPGVNTWHVVLPALEEMGVESVNIAFDMDAMSNPDVEKHLKAFIQTLKEKGYNVNFVVWNIKDGKGIDDMFLKRKYPQIRPL